MAPPDGTDGGTPPEGWRRAVTDEAGTGPGAAGAGPEEAGLDPSGDAGFEARIVRDGVAFVARDAALLRAIDVHGSLAGAAESLGRSFAHAQRRVVALEEAFGRLVERRRGGTDGGGSELTGQARDLLARFDRLRAEFAGVVAAPRTILAGRIAGRDGGLAVAETEAGPVRVPVATGADRVAVSVRADAVTLEAPTASPESGDTSARNRFAGEVVAVDAGEAVAGVTVAIGGGVHLAALVTTASVDRLGLGPGRPVVASFKATATRAVPIE